MLHEQNFYFHTIFHRLEATDYVWAVDIYIWIFIRFWCRNTQIQAVVSDRLKTVCRNKWFRINQIPRDEVSSIGIAYMLQNIPQIFCFLLLFKSQSPVFSTKVDGHPTQHWKHSKFLVQKILKLFFQCES